MFTMTQIQLSGVRMAGFPKFSMCTPLSHAGAAFFVPTLTKGGPMMVLPKFIRRGAAHHRRKKDHRGDAIDAVRLDGPLPTRTRAACRRSWPSHELMCVRSTVQKPSPTVAASNRAAASLK